MKNKRAAPCIPFFLKRHRLTGWGFREARPPALALFNRTHASKKKFRFRQNFFRPNFVFL